MERSTPGGRARVLYTLVDARDDESAPRHADPSKLVFDCLPHGPIALICCPTGSDLPDRLVARLDDGGRVSMSGICVVDRKLPAGVHRFYLKEPGRHPGRRRPGKYTFGPPRAVPDRQWASVEVAAARAIGARLGLALAAVGAFAALPASMRQTDPFGDGLLVGRHAQGVLDKVEQYWRVCDRSDRPRPRATMGLVDLLTGTRSFYRPPMLPREFLADSAARHVAELRVYLERAFSPPPRPEPSAPGPTPAIVTVEGDGADVEAPASAEGDTTPGGKRRGRGSRKHHTPAEPTGSISAAEGQPDDEPATGRRTKKFHIIEVYHRRRQRGESVSVRSIAAEVTCDPSQVSRVLAPLIRRDGRGPARGSKLDGRVEATDD